MEKQALTVLSGYNDKRESVLIKLYKKGKLGKFPVAENKVKAAFLFIKDFQSSIFFQRTTRNYDGLFITGRGRKSEASDFRCDAADRYLRALKYIEPYGVYALHFLRDDQNVHDFLLKYPILNQGSRRTYQMVYLAINRMLDKLTAFYDLEKEKQKMI